MPFLSRAVPMALSDVLVSALAASANCPPSDLAFSSVVEEELAAIQQLRDDPPLLILVVDDSPTLARGIAKHLRRLGYSALHAETGDRARKLFESHRPDAVLVDRVLPDVARGGEGLVQEFRYQRPNLQVAYMTAWGGLPSLEDPTLLKPIAGDYEARLQAWLRVLERLPPG